MTIDQEDALYDFLDNELEPFASSDLAAVIRQADSNGGRRINEEAEAFLKSRKLAFPGDEGYWVSRRSCFQPGCFCILPSRLEIQNGILIVGHRCLPFANPILLPHELSFLWKGNQVPSTTTEGHPEEFYPYFDLFGEEYAPQYIARDNPENEESFNADPYEDPPEVSVRTLDMRSLYRETGFVPGDRFALSVVDWKGGVFELQKVDKALWTDADLDEWEEAAEKGFKASFEKLGPGASTEEQIAFAYWYGGERMRKNPSYALEEFLYERTKNIDTVTYGMETRFWQSGKEIPDTGSWSAEAGPPDKTDVEALLASLGIPISEYVIESYVRDSFFRQDTDIHRILERLVPASIELNQNERLFLAQYVAETRDDFKGSYNIFLDKDMGPIRQRVAELHTAVIALVAQLSSQEMNTAWLPKHAFVTLSQLQVHAANLLEDLDFEEAPEKRELDGMENSLDGMIDTYEDIKEAIDQALNGFRRSRISLVKPKPDIKTESSWRTIQAALVGTGVWRRLLVSDAFNLEELHRCLLAAFGWKGGRLHGFVIDGDVYGPSPARDAENGDKAEQDMTIAELAANGISEIEYDYDYGAEWELRITLLHTAKEEGLPRCVAGQGAAPPEHSGGALRYRRFVSALKGEAGTEQDLARSELGSNFDPDAFNLEEVNTALAAAFSKA